MSSKKKRSAPSKEPEGPRPKRAKKGESSKTSATKVIPLNYHSSRVASKCIWDLGQGKAETRLNS